MATPPTTPAATAAQRTAPGPSHTNNFDALRIVAAFAVLYSHQFSLTGRPEPSFFGMHSWGGIAVIVFFVISGFLVTGSWYNDPSVLRFSARRALRLWPALTAVVVLTAYGLGAWVTTLPLEEYWKSRATLDYLNTIRMQIHYVLPGVFEHNPYARGVNGSLWTIPLEVRCYVVLAIAGLLRLMRWRTVWLACIALYMAWFLAKGSADVTGHIHYGRELSAFFLMGSALFVLREYWERRPLAWLLGLGAGAALLWTLGWRFTATLVFIPLLVLYVGTRSTPVIRRFGRFGDPSYGAYLLAFPVQQTVVQFLYPQLDFAATLALSTLITFVLAYASWHVIEKPALRLKPRRSPSKKHGSPPGGGLPAPAKAHPGIMLLAVLSCLLAAIGQAYYAVQTYTSATELLADMLPLFGAALLLCGALALLAKVRPPFPGRAVQTLLAVAALVAAVATSVAAIGFWQTGAIPRAQQLNGLTWDIVGPSILEIVRSNAIALVLCLLLLGAAALLLRALLRRASRSPVRPPHLAVAGLVLLAAGLGAAYQDASKGTAFIATQLFHSDLDVKQVLSERSLQIEDHFFKAYYRDLAETKGPARHPEILSQLRGSNIIWVVLESVRAKDLPLYGGTANMPHFMQAREHMLLLDHLYVQDPRSTKAYTQMDMGRFSLLSWDTYSNNIPRMFPQDGLAAHLGKLGYSTAALVNGDAHYDNNQLFQKLHGYQHTLYRQEINPGSPNADDLKLLEQAKDMMDKVRTPFYMMLWPIQTHHPYGRKYWSHEWSSNQTAKQSLDSDEHARYLKALQEADDWFGQLLKMLKAQGLDENTTIVVTGDHGQAFREHEPGNGFHGTGVYEESVHVPGLIYHPKINGLHRDDRNLRLLDMPATVLEIAASKEHVFNDGRSLFRNYKQDMPIFLFNSWVGAIGIIQDGHKLWRRTKSPQDIFFAPLAEIRATPGKERQRLNTGKGTTQLHMLNQWEAAMMTRSARLLSQTTSEQPPLNDIVRVYCDDGKGFREQLKGYAAFAGLSGQVTVAINSDCRALRIVPITNTPISQDKPLNLHIANLQAIGHHATWTLNDMELLSSHAAEAIGPHDFRITAESPFMDYRLGSGNHGIKEVAMDLRYTWTQRQADPQSQ